MPVYSDTFAGTNGSPLGVTEVGGLAWEAIAGSWSRQNGKAYTSTPGTQISIAAVDVGTGQIDMSANVSSGGGDALYFRVTDENNWMRLRVRTWTSSYQYYVTEYEYQYKVGWWTGPNNSNHEHIGYGFQYSWGYPPGYSHNHGGDHGHELVQIAQTGNTRQVGPYTGTQTNYQVLLEKCVAGTVTQIGSYSGSATALRIRAEGGSLVGYVDGTARITATDTTHQSATKHGIGRFLTENDQSSLDNFSIEPLLPPTPTVNSPANNSTVTTGTPTLQGTVTAWGSNTKLEYQLATDAAFTANVKTITEDNSQFRASGISSTPVSEANLLTQTGWYVRARQVSQAGQAGSWSNANFFTVAHSPGATNLAPANGQGVIVGASNRFSWTFTDTSPTDSQTAYRVVIERNDTAALVHDTGKVANSASFFDFTIDPSLMNVQLRWRVMVWDEEDKPSSWANYQLFIPTDAPTVTILEPLNGSNVGTSRPLIRWSFAASGGRSQSYYRTTVKQQGAAQPHYDSQQQAGNANQWLIDVPVIENAKTYEITVYVTDSLGITVSSTSVVQGVYEEPDVVTFSVETSTYLPDGYVWLTWQPVSDPSFKKWRVYRRRVGDTPWTMLAEIDEFTVTEYRDWLVPAMDTYDYYVVQVVQRFEAEVESFVGTQIRVELGVGGYWLIDPNSSVNNLRLENVTAETYTSANEQAEYTIVGRGRHVDEGEAIGLSGTMTVQFRDNSRGSARDKKKKLEALRAKKKPLYLRNPFGDVSYIALGELGVTRIAGTGSMEAVDVTVPYLQVF